MSWLSELYNYVKLNHPLTYVEEVPQEQSIYTTEPIVLITYVGDNARPSKDLTIDEEIDVRIHIIGSNYLNILNKASIIKALINGSEYQGKIYHYETMNNIDDTELEMKRIVLDFKLM